jgi:diguanylate cyclase (GGDEF)-like protein/PAS domain S-box-containing protein
MLQPSTTVAPADARSVLIIEDGVTRSALLRSSLERAEIGSVQVAGSLAAARAWLLHHDVDCIVTDLRVPDAAPEVLLAVLRASAPAAAVVRIGPPSSVDQVDGVHARVDSVHLGDPHRVVDAVCRALDAAGRGRTEVMAVPDLDRIADPACALDGRGRIVAVNRAWRDAGAARGGVEEAVGVGADYLRICLEARGPHHHGARAVAQGIEQVLLGTAPSFVTEYPCPTPDGIEQWFRLHCTPLGHEGGGAIVRHRGIDHGGDAPGTASDVVAEPTAPSRTDDAHHLDSLVLADLPVAVIVSDDAGIVISWNHQAAQLFGFTHAQAVGRPVGELITWPEGAPTGPAAAIGASARWEGEHSARHADGTTVPIHLSIHPVLDGVAGFSGVIATCSDRREQLRLQERMQYEAAHDAVTGLPHKALLIDRLDAGTRRAATSGKLALACLVVDLDGFRAVNELLGRPAGDDLLRRVASTLTSLAGRDGSVVRPSADEFIVLVDDVEDAYAAMALGERVAEAIADLTARGPRPLTASVGIALPAEDLSAGGVIRDARAAMVRAKARGRGAVEMADAEERARAHRLRDGRAAILAGLERDEFHVRFQPQVDLRTGAVYGAEALVRWRSPDGPLPPSDFIPLAEATGVIRQLGSFVLARACEAAARWRDRSPRATAPVIAINVSAAQLRDRGFPAEVAAALAAAGLPGSSLCIELTETVLIEDSADVVDVLRELKQIGVTLSVDDFGTGYSSLGYLKRLPIDEVKIDRSFVTHLGRDHEDAAIVRAVSGLGAGLGLRVVAEGVERPDQIVELRRLGCHHAQGFLWSAAVDADDLPDQVEVFEAAALDGVAEPADPTAVDEIIDMLLHELKNPLAVVRGFAEILVADPDVDVAEVSGHVVGQSLAMQRILGSLVDLRSVDQGTLQLQREVVELGAWAREVADRLPSLAHRVDVRVDGEIAAPIDPVRMEQVLANLLRNAGRYAPAGTPIAIEMRRTGDRVEVDVLDEGPGIPPERVAHAFAKYGRVDRSQPGTGLGLYLARGIVQRHGGTLAHRARPGGGSIFTIAIPT